MALYQIKRCNIPRWKIESKTIRKQPARNHAPAFRNQLGYGSQKDRAQLKHQSRRGQSERGRPKLFAVAP